MKHVAEKSREINLGESDWSVLEIPLGPDASWRYEEPSAKVSRSNGELEISVDCFERSHDEVQILDNPKHLIVSAESFPVPADGTATFTYEMAAEKFRGDPVDYRTGAAAFHVMDLADGWIFDQLATQTRTWSLHERLLLPGVVEPSEAFTWAVDRPLPALDVSPGSFLRYSIAISGAERRALWTVEGAPYFEVRDLPKVPESVVLALSVLTLSPQADGQSTCLSGQGMAGRWRNLRYAVS